MALACLSSKALVASTQTLGRTSNGTQQKVAMKSRSTYQVQIVVGEDEPQDNALKRFRREVMTAGKCDGSSLAPLSGRALPRCQRGGCHRWARTRAPPQCASVRSWS